MLLTFAPRAVLLRLLLAVLLAALGVVGAVGDSPALLLGAATGMALVNHPFPYDVTNLLSGAVSILYAEQTTAIPTDISDVISMTSPYASATGWTYLGATKEEFSYSRGFETEGLEIQQVAGAISEEVTDISRSITVSMAEFNPFGFQLMENAPSVATIAAAAGQSAQKKIAFGSFTSVKAYRFAFISRRPKAAGEVTEPGGAKRGRFVMGVAFNAQLQADEIEMAQGKGELTAVELAFSLLPEATVAQPEGQDVGAWFLEDSGTIAA